MLLEPLSEDETDELIASLLEGSTLELDLQARIRRAAGGNPLFVEEMLALARQSGSGESRYRRRFRRCSSRASISSTHQNGTCSNAVRSKAKSSIAEQSRRSAEARARLDDSLTALVRKDLLRPEQPQLAGEDGYRFRHLLIRDAAYEALPKATRAELHELFASWLERNGAELVELDEILGYHLEQAFRYRRELGPVSDDDRETAARAGELLARAGRRAHDRGDRAAAIVLFERAEQLLPEPSPAHVLAIARARAMSRGDRRRLGGEQDRSRTGTRRGGHPGARGPRVARTARTLVRQHHDGHGRSMPLRTRNWPGPRSQALEQHGDDEGVGRAWFVLASTYWVRARWDDMRWPLSQSIEYARRAGNRSMELEALIHDLAALAFGTTP